MPVGKMYHIEVKATSQSCPHEASTFDQKTRQKQEAAGEALWFWFHKIYLGPPSAKKKKFKLGNY